MTKTTGLNLSDLLLSGPLVAITNEAELCSLCRKRPAIGISPTGHRYCKDCLDTTPELIFTDDLADLLEAVEEWLRRFIVFPNDHGPIAVALWVAFTHVVDAFDVAPYLLITAPEIESGKTKLMEVAAPLCHRPMFSSSMTPAVLFRTIDRDHPTLLLDEADNIWTGRKDDKATELVALLNAGHRRGVKAQRMGGPGKTTLQEFDVFGPKAIAGAFPEVGNIPEALRSRSVHLRMQRKLPEERVDRWTRQTRERTTDEVEALRHRLARMLANSDIRQVQVDPIEELSDRNFDIWEGLLVIATLAGGDWPGKAHDAALALCVTDGTQALPYRVQVLRDIREVWEGEETFMLTQAILARLHKLEARPWGDFYGTPLTARRLGRFLASYGVESRFTPDRSRLRAYFRQDLTDLWARYTPETSQSSQSSHETPSTESESLERSESLGELTSTTSTRGEDQEGSEQAFTCSVCHRQPEPGDEHYTPDGRPVCGDHR